MTGFQLPATSDQRPPNEIDTAWSPPRVEMNVLLPPLPPPWVSAVLGAESPGSLTADS
jgi:hypothetical protein